MHQTINLTATGWLVTTPAAKRATRTYRYRLETESVAPSFGDMDSKSLDVCVAQPGNLELLETIVVLALPGYQLKRYWMPEDGCAF
jgi:hypothetical protein